MGMKTVQDASLTSVADAIRLKAEIEGTLEFPAQFISAIRNIPTGGGSVSVPPKDVNFYDYDGTVVDAYTASEFASLSAMPQNPKHKGLTAQGWNWSLADAKAYVAKYGRLNIGQMYVTTSGDTEIDIELHDGRLEPVLGISPNGTVEIDWGDGSAVDTVTGTSLTTNKNTQHIYASEGSYTITLHVVSGSFAIYCDSSNGCQLLHKTGTVANQWRTYQSAIQAVRIGANASIGNQAFHNCCSLASVTIPEGVTSIADQAFRNCRSLASLTIPEGVTTVTSSMCNGCSHLTSVSMPSSITTINAYAFQQCYNLESVTIPDGIPSVAISCFFQCYNLKSVTIPDSVTSIEQGAFQYCRCLESVQMFDGITSIGLSCFGNCENLKSVTIPDSVTSIEQGAFQYCSILASVTIPEGVTNISGIAFNSCYGIKEVILKPTTPPTLAGSNAFTNMASDRIFIVPKGSLEAYQTASNWSSYASYMQEEA